MTNNQQVGLFGGVFALTSLLQYGAARTAGKIAKYESKLEARQIKLNALSREADRKENLAKAMASANAASGTKGIAAFEGSPLAILDQMEKTSDRDTQRDEYMSGLAAKTAKYRGRQTSLGYQSQAPQSLINNSLQFMQAL